MGKYILKRILIAIPVLFMISVGAFILVHMTPGDPTDMYVTPDMDTEQIAMVKESLGLNQPLPVQYINWIKNLMSGNLGYSFSNSLAVTELLGQRIWPTLLLMLVSLVFAYATAIPLGMLAALNKNSWLDRFLVGWTFFNVSFPPFFMGLALIYVLAIKVPLFPPGGMEELGYEGDFLDKAWHLTLPALVMASQYSANMIRYVRASVLDVLSQNYIRTAVSKGLKSKEILLSHVIRNSLIPIVTVIGTDLPKAIGGAVVTEQIFQWPGIGSLTIASIASRDYPVLMAIVILSAICVLVANLVVDIAYAFIDPRIKYTK